MLDFETTVVDFFTVAASNIINLGYASVIIDDVNELLWTDCIDLFLHHATFDYDRSRK